MSAHYLDATNNLITGVDNESQANLNNLYQTALNQSQLSMDGG